MFQSNKKKKSFFSQLFGSETSENRFTVKELGLLHQVLDANANVHEVCVVKNRNGPRAAGAQGGPYPPVLPPMSARALPRTPPSLARARAPSLRAAPPAPPPAWEVRTP